jgi:hypothetical protein
MEQTLHGLDRDTTGLLQHEAWRRRPAIEDTLYVGDHRGLRVLARAEGPLRVAVAGLVARFGAGVRVDPPSVRYAHGVPVLEPWMSVLVNGPELFASLVERDLASRRGALHRLQQKGGAFVLEGEAPLAHLLGYADWLAELTDDDPYVGMWLSRYVPLDDGGGPRAA